MPLAKLFMRFAEHGC